MLRNSRDELLGSVESDLKTNLKRFLSILKLNSKSHAIPDRVSTPISASTFADPGNRTPLRSSAENPREIANLFNSYFASVLAYDNPRPPPISNRLEVFYHVGSLLDDGKQMDMICMDMSKAFDKVNHGCLLQKLHEFGFGGGVLQWFSSYLMGRYLNE